MDIEYRLRRGATSGEQCGRVSPSWFGKFARDFLRFSEKISFKISGFWKKISLKFSPISGETIPQSSSDFGRKEIFF